MPPFWDLLGPFWQLGWGRCGNNRKDALGSGDGFLSPFSKDIRFKDYEKSISDNLSIVNEWVSSDWRKVMNHILRYESDISKIPKLKDLSNALKQFKGRKLEIPKEILKDRDITDQFVDNIRDKYDIIDGDNGLVLDKIYNWPNPFSKETYLTFFINKPVDYTIKIFTTNGKNIRTYTGSTRGELVSDILWDGRDNFGRTIGNGVYLYKVFVTDSQGNKTEGLGRIAYVR